MKLRSIVTLIFLVLSIHANASQGKGQSPFLINSKGMPHLTKLVKQNWDNENLALNKEQKGKLILVRKDTVGNVMRLKPQILKLEEEIINLSMQGENLQKIYPMIEKLSQLKAAATKVHVNCIYNTKNILTDKQLNFLLQK